MLPMLPRTEPAAGQREWDEHGNIAIRLFCAPSDVPSGEDNTVDATWTLTVGGSILVRAKEHGFWMVDLQKDKAGWYVVCGSERVPIVFNTERGLWVATRLV